MTSATKTIARHNDLELTLCASGAECTVMIAASADDALATANLLNRHYRCSAQTPRFWAEESKIRASFGHNDSRTLWSERVEQAQTLRGSVAIDLRGGLGH